MNFDTGNDDVIKEQVLSAENGYHVLRPNEPIAEGKEFEGWYTADGQEFDFEKIVTESMTLHAKWDGKIVYTNKVVPERTNYMPYIAVGSSILLLVVAVSISIVIVKRGKRNDGAN